MIRASTSWRSSTKLATPRENGDIIMPVRFYVLLILTAAPMLVGQVYKDPKQPLEKRVDDLLSRMSLEEKASQMLSESPAVERLGIPAYDWWNECLHGV